MSSFFPVSEILRKYFNVLASQDLIWIFWFKESNSQNTDSLILSHLEFTDNINVSTRVEWMSGLEPIPGDNPQEMG